MNDSRISPVLPKPPVRRGHEIVVDMHRTLVLEAQALVHPELEEYVTLAAVRTCLSTTMYGADYATIHENVIARLTALEPNEGEHIAQAVISVCLMKVKHMIVTTSSCKAL